MDEALAAEAERSRGNRHATKTLVNRVMWIEYMRIEGLYKNEQQLENCAGNAPMQWAPVRRDVCSWL